MKVESVKPYSDSRPKGAQVEEMFDSIAPDYDFLNRAMTFGIDRLWRRRTVRETVRRVTPRAKIVDLATGTGDMALALAKKLAKGEIIGLDLSENMLAIARKKAEKQGVGAKISFVKGDGLSLPLEEGEADGVTIAFGIRNFEDIAEGYREMFRVIRQGGTVAVLELSTPTSPVPRAFHRFYTRKIIPLMGKIVSRDRRAYSYLPESVSAVPQGDEMLSLMRDAGFEECVAIPLTFGTASIYLGRKPQ